MSYNQYGITNSKNEVAASDTEVITVSNGSRAAIAAGQVVWFLGSNGSYQAQPLPAQINNGHNSDLRCGIAMESASDTWGTQFQVRTLSPEPTYPYRQFENGGVYTTYTDSRLNKVIYDNNGYAGYEITSGGNYDFICAPCGNISIGDMEVQYTFRFYDAGSDSDYKLIARLASGTLNANMVSDSDSNNNFSVYAKNSASGLSLKLTYSDSSNIKTDLVLLTDGQDLDKNYTVKIVSPAEGTSTYNSFDVYLDDTKINTSPLATIGYNMHSIVLCNKTSQTVVHILNLNGQPATYVKDNRTKADVVGPFTYTFVGNYHG